MLAVDLAVKNGTRRRDLSRELIALADLVAAHEDEFADFMVREDVLTALCRHDPRSGPGRPGTDGELAVSRLASGAAGEVPEPVPEGHAEAAADEIPDLGSAYCDPVPPTRPGLTRPGPAMRPNLRRNGEPAQ